ncbi:unnamed protein product [Chironomus riparius]|uniref:Kinetochore protein SPC25 n=1 Tax=Chironomus riparius TaxID=315576 RepID=A0A9N9RS87_9DIPT|nr:unnamed protein product [Chironomus riparius]
MSKLKTSEVINNLFDINHELMVKFKKYMELKNISKAVESTKYSKMEDLSQTKLSCIEIYLNLEELEGRNKSIREKFSTIDEFLREKSKMICEEAKMIFGHLGLRINVTEFEDRPSLMEVLFEFSNDHSCYVKLIYDIDTDDYDLLEMVPVQKNFNDIKGFLRSSGDIQGLIYTFWSCNRTNINISNISDDRSSLME